MRIVQLSHTQHGRRVGVVEIQEVRLLRSFRTAYDLANAAIKRGSMLDGVAREDLGDDSLRYDEIYGGKSEWKLLVPFDHPQEPARCLVSGTGLTHKASAENRARMHRQQAAAITDSMTMYQWGLEGGSPPAGTAGAQPEWFYKGNGSILRAPGEALRVPEFGDDGGEEPEIAGVYLIGSDGTPFRVGLTTGNEFSDHKMEQKNYLYLAPSKLRECAIGPELITGAEFGHVEGNVSIERGGVTVWSAIIFSGERNMSHTVANLEHHHFKYSEHCRPGDVHVHFFGADAFSFGEGFALEEGDWMNVSWNGFGRPLRNPIEIRKKFQTAAKKVAILG